MANNTHPSKMVIVTRRDIVDITGKDPSKMGVGKLIAQISHGVLGVILDKMRSGVSFEDNVIPADDYTMTLEVKKNTALSSWLEEGFTKVVLAAKNETQFLNAYNKIKDAGIEVTLIQDSGHTVFEGKPTYTCFVVEPSYKEDIDKLTKKLQVLNLKVDCDCL